MAFTSKFLSIAGQKERLKNVGNVLSIALNPFSKDEIKASTSSKTVNALLEAGANSPYSTIALVGSAGSGSLLKGTTKVVSSLKPTTKIIGALVGTVGAGTLLGSEKARVATIKTIGGLTPEKLIKGGKEAGQLLDSPSLKGAKEFLQQNPVLVGATAVAGGILATKSLPAVSNLLNREATLENAEAIREQTEAMKDLTLQGNPNTTVPEEQSLPTTPIPAGSPNNPIVAPSVGEEPKRKRRKVKPKPIKKTRRLPKYRKIYKEEVFSYPNGNNRRCN
jgi:hypothetical protein